jgi:hypothetical protein
MAACISRVNSGRTPAVNGSGCTLVALSINTGILCGFVKKL